LARGDGRGDHEERDEDNDNSTWHSPSTSLTFTGTH
jgi:hypothetical protein